MSKEHSENGGTIPAPNPNPKPPPTGPDSPLPPLPPVPLPPIKLETIADVCKIVFFVVIWYVTSDANHALTASVDYSAIASTHNSLWGASWHGASIGFLQGCIMAVQGLAVIWASPTLFAYLGPVLSAALATPIKLVADFRRALHPRSGDDDPDKKKT